MSYDLMVFDHSAVPCEFGQLKQWWNTHMEEDKLPDKPPAVFLPFLENVKKAFPSMDDCPEDKMEYACDYEIHEAFIYMCFGYSVSREANDIVKRQAKIDDLGFWDVSQSFDRTFPVTLPTDKWPMLAEAEWIKYGRQYVYCYEEVRKILVQMKTAEQSSFCLTDRHGNYIQVGGYGDAFTVEVRKYIDAIAYQHMRADIKEEPSDADAFVRINGWKLKVPRSQIFSKVQACSLVQDFTEENKLNDESVFWKKIDI